MVVVTGQVEEARDQLVSLRATEVLEGMDEDLGERRGREEREESPEESRRSFGRVASDGGGKSASNAAVKKKTKVQRGLVVRKNGKG